MLKTDHRLTANSRSLSDGRRASGTRLSRTFSLRLSRANWATASGLIILVAALFVFLLRDRLWATSEHVVLSLQGSTSLGDELMPNLAAAFLRDEMGAVETGFKVAGKDAKGHTRLHVWGKVPGRAGLQVIEVYATGSSAAFECLAVESGAHSCDIGMSSRPMNDSDKASYPALQNLGNRGNEHVVALD